MLNVVRKSGDLLMTWENSLLLSFLSSSMSVSSSTFRQTCSDSSSVSWPWVSSLRAWETQIYKCRRHAPFLIQDQPAQYLQLQCIYLHRSRRWWRHSGAWCLWECAHTYWRTTTSTQWRRGCPVRQLRRFYKFSSGTDSPSVLDTWSAGCREASDSSAYREHQDQLGGGAGLLSAL